MSYATYDVSEARQLLARLGDSDASVRRKAAEHIREQTDTSLQNAVIDVLGTWLKSSDPHMRKRAVHVLGVIATTRSSAHSITDFVLKNRSTEVTEAIVECLDDSHKKVRKAAAISLEKIGRSFRAVSNHKNRYGISELRNHNKVVEGLISCLDDIDEEIRLAAINSLSWIRPVRPDVISELMNCLDEQNNEIVGVAACAISSVISRGQIELPEAGVDKLIDCLDNQNPKARIWAAKALGIHGTDRRSALEGIITCLQDGLAQRSWPSVYIDHPDPDAWVNRWLLLNASYALGELGKHRHDVITGLIDCLEHDTEEVRQVAATALGKITDRSDLYSALNDLLTDESEEVRKAANKALRSLESTESDQGSQERTTEGLEEKSKTSKKKDSRLGELREGDVVWGEVVSIKDYGAFVRLRSDATGLIHVSQMTEEWVDHPRDIVSQGQQVKVSVLDISVEEEEIALRLLQTDAEKQVDNTAPISDTEGDATSGIERETLLVDGSNVCYWGRDDEKMSLNPLLTLLLAFIDHGFDFECIFDANIRHKLNRSDKKIYDRLEEDLPRRFSKVTGRVEADIPLLQKADAHELRIVTNDLYKKYRDEYSWLTERESERLLQGGGHGRDVLVYGLMTSELITDTQQMADELVKKVQSIG